MCCPAGVGYTDMASAVFVCCEFFQVCYLALCFIDIEFVLSIDECYSGTVISSIFELLQSCYQDWICFVLSYISYYSTHKFMVMSLYSDLILYFLYFFRKPTRPSFIDKAGCTQQFESELSLRSLAPLFPIKEGFTSHLVLLQ